MSLQRGAVIPPGEKGEWKENGKRTKNSRTGQFVRETVLVCPDSLLLKGRKRGTKGEIEAERKDGEKGEGWKKGRFF